MVLEFFPLGIIGKMLESLGLSLTVEFILKFYRDKPIDWLLDPILPVCNPRRTRSAGTHTRPTCGLASGCPSFRTRALTPRWLLPHPRTHAADDLICFRLFRLPHPERCFFRKRNSDHLWAISSVSLWRCCPLITPSQTRRPGGGPLSFPLVPWEPWLPPPDWLLL